MIPKDRRQPTLADRFVAKRYGAHDRLFMPSKTLDALQRKTRAAHKYVLDEKAAIRIGNVIRDIPDLIIREYDFARAPYDLTWIEFPHDKFWLACGNDPNDQDADCDLMLGYLIDGNTTTVVMGGTIGRPEEGPFPGVLQFQLNTEWPEQYRPEIEDTHGIDQLLWGSSLKHFDEATCHKLRMRTTVKSLMARPRDEPEFFSSAVRGHVGEVRNIVAFLLMLNRPTISRYSNVQGGHGFVSGKMMNYMSHTSVTIDLDAVPTMRLLGTPEGEGVPRRWHEVEGHYCHDRVARDYHRIAGCIHDFEPTRGPLEDWEPWPDAPIGTPGSPGCARNWVCSHCGGKRWFVNEHTRGDPSVGMVIHDDYRVTAR